MAIPLPLSTFVKENNNISLTCVSDGWPRVDITWYRETEQLMNERGKYSIQTSEENEDGIIRVKSVLTVFQVSRHEAGTYTCKSESVVCSAESSTELIVRCKCVFLVGLKNNHL